MIFIFPNLCQIYCNANFKGLTKYEPNTFKNLTKLKLLTQVDCGFTNEGIKEVDWSDLVSTTSEKFLRRPLEKTLRGF